MPTKILAIDDSKTIRLAIKITFAAEDAEVTAVGKGAEGLARARQVRPDAILIDHALGEGEMSGADLSRQFAADPATADIPRILMVPARQGPVADEVLRDCGVAAAIGKPFDSQELVTLVQSVLGSGTTARPSAAASPAASPATATRPRPAAGPTPRPNVSRPSPRPSPNPASPRPSGLAGAAAGRTLTPGAGLRRPLGGTPASSAGQSSASASPAAGSTARPTTAPSAGAQGAIPVATPIPFAPATAPTPGMLARLEAAAKSAGEGASNIDPQTAKALLALSHEVVERVVWEVVPELAEMVIRDRQQSATP